MKAGNIFISLLTKIITENKFIRDQTVKQLLSIIKKDTLKNNDINLSEKAKLIRYYGTESLILSFLRNYDKGNISKEVAEKLIATLVKEAIIKKNSRKKINEYKEKYGEKPPNLITISPTKKCNLKCTGCYAASSAKNTEKLDWNTLNKLMKQTHDLMGIRFYVISGGEPLLYEDKGKGILDLAKKYNDCFFLMYTNGTLITKKISKKMKKLGNITPAISVEGYEKETEKRRGKGIYSAIKKAMNNLKEEGVPYGVSVTATKENVNILTKEKFYDYYFNELNATYMWIFQFMPIGRASTDLMLTPNQRIKMFREWKKQLIDKKRFVADFWNSAILSNGCISCGRFGGYFYVDWNGNIMPCVFIPYYKDNIYNLFKNKKTIVDAMYSDLFKEGRKWQNEYLGYKDGKAKNLLMPCFIRDHYDTFRKVVKKTNPKPEDINAKKVLNDKKYYNKLIKFDKELKKLTEEIWKKEF